MTMEEDKGEQWAAENKMGRDLADKTFNALAGRPEMLPHAVLEIRAMAERLDGVSAGYLTRLCVRAI